MEWRLDTWVSHDGQGAINDAKPARLETLERRNSSDEDVARNGDREDGDTQGAENSAQRGSKFVGLDGDEWNRVNLCGTSLVVSIIGSQVQRQESRKTVESKRRVAAVEANKAKKRSRVTRSKPKGEGDDEEIQGLEGADFGLRKGDHKKNGWREGKKRPVERLEVGTKSGKEKEGERRVRAKRGDQ